MFQETDKEIQIHVYFYLQNLIRFVISYKLIYWWFFFLSHFFFFFFVNLYVSAYFWRGWRNPIFRSTLFSIYGEMENAINNNKETFLYPNITRLKEVNFSFNNMTYCINNFLNWSYDLLPCTNNRITIIILIICLFIFSRIHK